MISKRTLPIVLFVLSAFISCTEKVEHQFVYADGTLIRDSSDLRPILNEIDGILNDNRQKSLKIQSSLVPSNQFACSKLLDSLRERFTENLIERYPKEKKWIEKMNPNWLLSCGIIVIDNQTGQIIGYQNNQADRNLIFDMPIFGTSNKIYGFLVAMDKEFEEDDEYVYYQESRTVLANGRKDTTKYENRYPIKHLFGTSDRGTIRRYPYQDYTKKDWQHYNKKMDFNLRNDTISPNRAVLYESSFFDLVRTFAMINNGGKHFSSRFVSQVMDKDENILFKNNCIGASLVSKQTIKEMKALLKYNMTLGYGEGAEVKKKLSLDDNHLVYFGRNTDSRDWILCSNEKYTIGIITTMRLNIVVPGYGRRHLYLSKWTSPRKCMPILAFVLKQLEAIDSK